MPGKMKLSDVSTVDPITAAEARDLCKILRVPPLDDKGYEGVAKRLALCVYAHVAHITARRYKDEATAVRTLLGLIEPLRQANWPPGPKEGFLRDPRSVDPFDFTIRRDRAERLHHDLRAILPMLDPHDGRREVPVWEEVAIRCWCIASGILESAGRRCGVGPNSVAVKFAVKATQRLGFADLNETAVSRQLRKWLRK